MGVCNYGCMYLLLCAPSRVALVPVLPCHTHNSPFASPVTTRSAPCNPHTAVKGGRPLVTPPPAVVLTAGGSEGWVFTSLKSPYLHTRLRPLMPQNLITPEAPGELRGGGGWFSGG